MRLIFGYVRRHWGLAAIAVAFLTIETLSDLLQPTLMSMVVDDGVARRDVSAVLNWGVIMLAVAFAGAIGAVVRNIYASRASQLIGKDIRSDAYSKVMSLTFEEVDRLQPGAIITRITNDVTQIQNFTQGLMRVMLKSPITCIGAIALIIIQIPDQAPVVAVILAIAGVLIWMNMTRSFPRFLAVQKALDKLGTISREFLRSVRVVKAFGAQRQEAERFDTAAGDFATANIRATRVNATYGPLINLTVNMGIVALLWLSRAQNPGRIGALMASMNYMTQVLFALGRVAMILNSSVRASASSRRIGEIFEQPSEERVITGGTVIDSGTVPVGSGTMLVGSGETAPSDNRNQPNPAHAEHPALRFTSVSYRYASAADDAVHDVDLSVPRGVTLGIIGPTGSGKSTLVSLIPRFYEPSRGRIELDRADIASIDVEILRERIALVPQEPVLFSGTIRSNLLWGNPEASEAQLREAVRLACASEFIDELPNGLDSVIGQGGVNLSGGQKQRISLARALTRRPEVLILDDCTSALDSTTEQRVLDHLRELAAHEQGLTTMLISQRISTVRRCSSIAVMDGGTVVATGSHDALMEQSPQYRSIYDSQIGEEYSGEQHSDRRHIGTQHISKQHSDELQTGEETRQ
ncbi:MAG: ABC transporter ATP-binding protein/permease [Bifidobacterium tibiigranuli]|jgi:ATP-binding cassette subfamily B protein|uniref:ABC transporter ATP-binding protein n=1 Tax=Bifidobacterium tibiigranuli TaxID=2172043 RepID=UPI0026F2144A|nr:ABC transporter ATP-binding protein [Bifidobacterium tibiigranuli]MCI1673549.1 ABC transporter ATP-binding protein/permease [Bifidobacterium tibiigranuli]MCI1713856.1 ABC transporter ATP-binding protein/permease [Bifidobacterium tibiigranuli]